jgi:hypothetical protein
MALGEGPGHDLGHGGDVDLERIDLDHGLPAVHSLSQASSAGMSRGRRSRAASGSFCSARNTRGWMEPGDREPRRRRSALLMRPSAASASSSSSRVSLRSTWNLASALSMQRLPESTRFPHASTGGIDGRRRRARRPGTTGETADAPGPIILGLDPPPALTSPVKETRHARGEPVRQAVRPLAGRAAATPYAACRGGVQLLCQLLQASVDGEVTPWMKSTR